MRFKGVWLTEARCAAVLGVWRRDEPVVWSRAIQHLQRLGLIHVRLNIAEPYLFMRSVRRSNLLLHVDTVRAELAALALLENENL